jgi:hypothetical protein
MCVGIKTTSPQEWVRESLSESTTLCVDEQKGGVVQDDEKCGSLRRPPITDLGVTPGHIFQTPPEAAQETHWNEHFHPDTEEDE